MLKVKRFTFRKPYPPLSKLFFIFLRLMGLIKETRLSVKDLLVNATTDLCIKKWAKKIA